MKRDPKTTPRDDVYVYITDRGSHWEQLRWQVNITGNNQYEESYDTMALAIEESVTLSPDRITIYLEQKP